MSDQSKKIRALLDEHKIEHIDIADTTEWHTVGEEADFAERMRELEIEV